MSEPDYESIPAIAISQWRVGRVLSHGDVALIGRLLAEHDAEMAQEVDTYASAREQVLRELGGQELVDLDGRQSELVGKIAWKRACIKVAEREAELAKLNN